MGKMTRSVKSPAPPPSRPLTLTHCRIEALILPAKTAGGRRRRHLITVNLIASIKIPPAPASRRRHIKCVQSKGAKCARCKKRGGSRDPPGSPQVQKIDCQRFRVPSVRQFPGLPLRTILVEAV